ncbi:hypothetical protein [Streptomyces sp. NPDC004266]|uniref:hypothetical protein n=1 Tax=Streptomyces sp. NPDC004266 TaxID=3364693 RepID=UPI0036AD09E8
MALELTAAVRSVLAAAGYDTDNGLDLHEHVYGVVVTWPAGSPAGAALGAPPVDADRAARPEVSGGRAGTAGALVAVLKEAGFRAVAHPEGFILVTRSPRPGGA